MGKKAKESEMEGDSHPPAGTEDVRIDMENRDPNDLNDHIQVRFADTIGEPIGAHSEDCVWLNAFKAYRAGSNCCYTCLTYVCAIPLAFCWGCYFSCLTFCHIWSITPWLRAFKINFSSAARFFSALVHCFCDPFYESLSLMFTKFYINVRSDADEYKERTYSGIKLFSGPVKTSGSSPLLSPRRNTNPDTHSSSSRRGNTYENKAAEADMYDDLP